MSAAPDLSAAIRELHSAIIGAVLTPEAGGFAEARMGYVLPPARQPDVIVVPESTADVANTVQVARRYGLPVAVQLSGHGPTANASGGILIRTNKLTNIAIDSATKTATIGAGVLWGELQSAAAAQGLFGIAGSAPTVGVVGFLLGGGIGPVVRSYGASSDYLLSAEVVTGSGEVVTAIADEHADLLWALRGGKVGFGIVTSATVQLVDTPDLYAGSLWFAAEHIATVLTGWVEWIGSAPPDISTSLALMHFPPLPDLPEWMRGQSLISLRVATTQGEEEGKGKAAALRALAPVLIDNLGPLPTTEFSRIHSDPPNPGPYWIEGTLLDGLDAVAVETVLSQFGDRTSTPLMILEFRHIGDALAQDVPAGSAMPMRAGGVLMTAIGIDPGGRSAELDAALAGLRDSLGAHVRPELSANFIGKIRSAESFHAHWPASIATRLAEVRATYDPDGLFDIARGLTPTT